MTPTMADPRTDHLRLDWIARERIALRYDGEAWIVSSSSGRWSADPSLYRAIDLLQFDQGHPAPGEPEHG